MLYHSGLYHYSLSTSQNKEYSIIMKRMHILDCYVVPYNHIILKAFEDRTEFLPLYKINSWWSFQEKYEETLPSFHDTPIKDLLINHSIVPLSELYALSDSNRVKDISSVKTEYVSTHEILKPKFKKLSTSNSQSYELPGTGFFQMVSNNVLRHKGRLNGDKVLLVESCLW